jgi:hypothetical protein
MWVGSLVAISGFISVNCAGYGARKTAGTGRRNMTTCENVTDASSPSNNLNSVPNVLKKCNLQSTTQLIIYHTKV